MEYEHKCSKMRTACSKMTLKKYQEFPFATWSFQLCQNKNMPWETVCPEGETWGKSMTENCSLRQNYLDPWEDAQKANRGFLLHAPDT